MEEFSIEDFKHFHSLRVRFNEVDLLGVCNNAVYFNYFETARLEYLKSLKIISNIKDIYFGETHFLMVNNVCDYKEPAYYDDELKIFTRVSFLKNSSFGFAHIVQKVETGKIIAVGSGVWVHVERKTRKSTPLEKSFIEKVHSFEKAL